MYIVGAKKGSMQRAPLISGECLWQLEKSRNPLNGTYIYCIVEIQVSAFGHGCVYIILTIGDQFQYGDECCIKHLVTQQYLAVTTQDEKYSVR